MQDMILISLFLITHTHIQKYTLIAENVENADTAHYESLEICAIPYLSFQSGSFLYVCVEMCHGVCVHM